MGEAAEGMKTGAKKAGNRIQNGAAEAYDKAD